MSSAYSSEGPLRPVSCWSSQMTSMPRALWHTSVTNWYYTATLSTDRILLLSLISNYTYKFTVFLKVNLSLDSKVVLTVSGKSRNNPKWNVCWCVYLPNCELVPSLTVPHRTLFSWGTRSAFEVPQRQHLWTEHLHEEKPAIAYGPPIRGRPGLRCS